MKTFKFLNAFLLSLISVASFAAVPEISIIAIRNTPNYDSFSISIKNQSSEKKIFCKELIFPTSIAIAENCGADVFSNDPLILNDLTFDPNENKNFKEFGLEKFKDVSERVKLLINEGTQIVYCPMAAPARNCGYMCKEDDVEYHYDQTWTKQIQGGSVTKRCNSEGNPDVLKVECDSKYLASSTACQPRPCGPHEHGSEWDSKTPFGSFKMSCSFGAESVVPNSTVCDDGYQASATLCSPKNCDISPMSPGPFSGSTILHGGSNTKQIAGGYLTYICNYGRTTSQVSCNQFWEEKREIFYPICARQVCLQLIHESALIAGSFPTFPTVVTQYCDGEWAKASGGNARETKKYKYTEFRAFCGQIPPEQRPKLAITGCS